jgi:molybdopterin molybdotransferase
MRSLGSLNPYQNMLTVEEAFRLVMERSSPLPPARRVLGEALGCLLAEDVIADLDSPPFDKALVDGYAVRSADLLGEDRWLQLGEEITAGRTPTRPLGPREAAAIMTGAPLPPEADAVVMIERTRREGDRVLIDDAAVAPGWNRLRRGREMEAGEVVLRRGERLNPARLGLLASVGRSEVAVIPRPRVAVVPTGDELVEPDRVPGPGQIRNSNVVMLRALAVEAGAEAEALPITPDDPDRLAETLRRGMEADVLVITGGVSAGNRDLVPATLERLGVVRAFHKIRLKPGKPLWFGVGPARGDAPGPLVFGLPGNPVSGVVGFLLFVRPALDTLAARPARAAEAVRAPLALPYMPARDRPTYHPARWTESCLDADFNQVDRHTIEPLDWAGSADLRTVAQADGFAIFPEGDRAYEVGEIVGFLPLR